MAVDVIDLVSSDDDPAPIYDSQRPASVTSTLSTARPATSSIHELSLSRKAAALKTSVPPSDWINLSDDDEPLETVPASSYDLPPFATVKPVVAQGLKSSHIGTTKSTAVSATSRTLRDKEPNERPRFQTPDEFLDLSDELNVLSSPKPTIIEPPKKKPRLSPIREQTEQRKEVEVLDLLSSDSEVEQTKRSTVQKSAVDRLPTTSNAIRTLRRATSTLEDDYGTAIERPALQKRAGNGLKRSRTITGDSDPIVWSSSPPRPRAIDTTRTKKPTGPSTTTHEPTGISLDDDNWREPSSDSDADLPDLNEVLSLSQAGLREKLIASKVNSHPSTKRTEPAKSVAARLAKEAKQEHRAQQLREKAMAKELEQAEKRKKKAEKELEKQRATTLAKLNTLRTDKKAATPEMMVDLPMDLDLVLAGQVKELLTGLGVEHRVRPAPVPNIIKWRRKVVSRYNEELDIWEPTGAHIKTENFVLCVMKAQEFVDLATASDAEGKDLDSHVLQMRSKFDGHSIIYLIEGLNAWMRKNRGVRNRAYTEAVRNQGQESEPSVSQRGRKKKPAEYVDEDMVEDALLKLQIEHEVKIHHTSVTIETAEWIVAFTQHIATVPYRTHRSVLANTFCMESGQVKTGATPAETYVRMLEEIARITAPIAHGIVAEYPTLPALVQGLQKNGPDALEDCRKSANKDGAFTDRRIGKAVSRRVWRIFTSTDENCVDV